MRFPFLILSPLLLAGCATDTVMTSPTPADSGGPAPLIILYHCDAGREFMAMTRGDTPDQVNISAGRVAANLPAVPSASGARYARGKMEFWSKGDEAKLSGFAGGPYTNCKKSVEP